MRLAFIRPLNPSAAVRPPLGDDWLHEPKWDGFRCQIVKDGREVRLYSRHGAEYTDRLPGMAEAFGKLATQSAILDGELCLIDPRGSAHFYRLMAQMRTSSPDEAQLMFMVFDLLHPALVRAQARSHPALSQVEGAVPKRGANFSKWHLAARSLQQVRVRRCRQQAPGVTLFERAKPQLGQVEMLRTGSGLVLSEGAFSRARPSRC